MRKKTGSKWYHMFQEPPGTWRSHIYSAYYARPYCRRTHARTQTCTHACSWDMQGRSLAECGPARPLGAVQRATGTASLPVPLSNQTDPTWSSLLGFCLRIGCSLEYLGSRRQNARILPENRISSCLRTGNGNIRSSVHDRRLDTTGWRLRWWKSAWVT